MSRLFAYSATQAGIARLARERQAPALTVEAPKPERVSAPRPVANVVRLVIPRTEAQQIIADVAHAHGLTYADLIGKERWRHFVAARHEAIAAVKNAKPVLTLPQLGRLFRRDFSTIAHALKKMGMD